jgi:tetratricopeptide (TPR) repeat protein
MVLHFSPNIQNKLNMKYFLFFSILASTIFIMSCQSKNSTQDVPKLLMRSHVIGPEDEMGHTLDAYNKITAKIKSNPNDVDARLSLTELFMQEARISGEHGYYYPAALSLLEDVLKEELKDPFRYRALLDKASVLMSLHQFAEAKVVGEQALALNAYSADVYGVLVDAHVELGDYDNAVKLADKMVSIRPDLRSYSRVSYLREIYGQVDGAKEAMKLAVSAGYPGMEQTEWARLTLGHLYERYGSLDSAMMQYELALVDRPNYPFAIAAMANTYAAMGENKKADSLNQIAKNLIPEVSFFVHQAMWEKERGNTAKVESMTKEILQMMADDEKAGHKMGLELARVHLELLNDPDRALTYAMEEYKVRPDNIDINRMLAEIYYTKGDIAKSQEHLTKALHTGSVDPQTKCLEGLIIAKTNNREEGSKMLKAVFASNPHLECAYCKEARSLTI